jgi:hypothetical protein
MKVNMEFLDSCHLLERFQVKNIDKTRQCGFEFEAVYIVTTSLNYKLKHMRRKH